MAKLHFIFIFAAASLRSSCSEALRFLRGKLPEEPDKQIRPSPHLDIDLVVEKISNHLYESSLDGGAPLPSFVVAGSYPSALKAYAHDNTFILPYNDIDVFIPRMDPRDPECEYRRIQRTYYKVDLIPDMEVNFVYACFNSMDHLVSDFDINNILVGFEVVPTYDMEEQKMVGTIDSWYTEPSYDEFLETRVLDIATTNKQTRDLSNSLIRLLRKAEQLQLDYKMWDTDKLRALIHGSTFGTKTMGKLERLPKELQNEVYNRFDIWELHKGKYMLVLKGEEPPPPDPVAIARKLRVANCDYTGDCTTTAEPEPEQAPRVAIIHHLSDLAVTVYGCDLLTPVTLEPYSVQNQGQQWRTGPNRSIVSVLCPNRVLDVRARNCETRDIILWSPHGGTNQQWDMSAVLSSSFGPLLTITNAHCSQQNLDVPTGTAGTRVTLSEDGQRSWRVQNVE